MISCWSVEFIRSNRPAKPNLELKRLVAHNLPGHGLEHIERTPVVGQSFNEKWNNRSASLKCRYRGARVPRPLHLDFEVHVGKTCREDRKNGLLPIECLGISKELNHGAGRGAVLNWQDYTIVVAQQAHEVFQQPIRRIRLRNKLHQAAALDQNLGA